MMLSSYIRPRNSPSDLKKIQNLKKCRHDVRYTPLPPSPDAPSAAAAVANDEVALALLPLPSPISNAPPRIALTCRSGESLLGRQ
jgi:hypothetical protein